MHCRGLKGHVICKQHDGDGKLRPKAPAAVQSVTSKLLDKIHCELHRVVWSSTYEYLLDVEAISIRAAAGDYQPGSTATICTTFVGPLPEKGLDSSHT